MLSKFATVLEPLAINHRRSRLREVRLALREVRTVPLTSNRTAPAVHSIPRLLIGP